MIGACSCRTRRGARYGDAHVVNTLLRNDAGEGRLGLDELEERLEATWGATVHADLVPIVVDLPGGLAARR